MAREIAQVGFPAIISKQQTKDFRTGMGKKICQHAHCSLFVNDCSRLANKNTELKRTAKADFANGCWSQNSHSPRQRKLPVEGKHAVANGVELGGVGVIREELLTFRTRGFHM
jgi:hypothetical protein